MMETYGSAVGYAHNVFMILFLFNFFYHSFIGPMVLPASFIFLKHNFQYYFHVPKVMLLAREK